MLNLSPNRNNRINQMRVEKIDLEINDRETKLKLPRHVSCLENKSYSLKSRSTITDKIPDACSLDQNYNSVEAINLAVDIIKYQLHDRLCQQKHLENLLINLKHRIEVARATGNAQLVNILQQEFSELTA
ncbi:MAG: hypothetical protein AAF383_15245 [Cyanobacteria bacterium P01_A01_bin.83]